MQPVHIDINTNTPPTYDVKRSDYPRIFLDVAKYYVPHDTLIAGPYIGEFGFELMYWASYVIGAGARFKKRYIITYPGRDAIYPGWTSVYHDGLLSQAGYGLGRVGPDESKEIVRRFAEREGLRHYSVFHPWMVSKRVFKICLPKANWLVLGSELKDAPRHDVVLHFRNILKAGPDDRSNFTNDRAAALAGELQKRGYSLCCIGSPKHALCPPGVTDMRSDDVSSAIRAIRGARVIVGQQSGPTHLANLCGKDVILWAEGEWRIAMGRKWNPHNCNIHVVRNDTFNPEPAEIAAKVEQVLGRPETLPNPL